MIVMFEDDILYGRGVSVPRPSPNRLDYTIEWDMSRLQDGFNIVQCLLCTSIVNTCAL